MVELLVLSHDHVCNIMCIKRYAWQDIAKQAYVKAVGILEKSWCKKRFIGGDHDKTSRLGSYLWQGE